MVALQHLGGAREVELLLAALSPRQLGDRLEVGADDLPLHRLARRALEARQLAVDLLARGLGQRQRGELLAQRVGVVRLVALAELLLDRLELLAQVELPLPAAELLLDLRLDLLLGVDDGELALDEQQHAPQALLDRQRLEQRLPLGERHVQVGGDGVGELAGVVDLGEEAMDHLARESQLGAELGGPLAHLAHQRHVRRRLGVERRQLLRVAHGRHEVVVVLRDAQRDRAALAVEDQLHPGRAALHLHDPRDRADRVEDLRGRGVGVLALRRDERQALGFRKRRLDRRQRRRPAGRDRDRHAGEQHGLAERNHGKERVLVIVVAPQAGRWISATCRPPPTPASIHELECRSLKFQRRAPSVICVVK